MARIGDAPEPPRPDRGATRGIVLLVLGLALASRLVVGWFVNLDPEVVGGVRGFSIYRILARNLLSGEGLYFHYYFGLGDRWANRPPLYPLLLAGLRFVSGNSPIAILVAQSLLGALTAALAAVLAGRVGGRGAALLAGLMAAFYPYAVGNDTTLVEQPLYVLLVLLFVWAVLGARDAALGPGGLTLRSAAAAGLAGGLAALTRETFNPFLGLVLLWALLRWRPARFRRRLAWVGVCAVVFLAVCSPWLWRNHRRFGVPAFAFATGKSLWVGNNALTFMKYPTESIDDSETLAWAALPELDRERILAHTDDERVQDGVFREIAVRYIRSQPGQFAQRGCVKVAAAFAPVLVPTTGNTVKELAYLLSYGPLLLVAALSPFLLPRRWRPTLVITALALLSVVAVSFVFWGQTRLRATYDVFLIVLAAGVLDQWRRRIRGEFVEE